MSNFKQRTYNAANFRANSADLRRQAAMQDFFATLETGRPEEIRVAHNDAVDAFQMSLFALEDRERVLLTVNDVDPRLRHIP